MDHATLTGSIGASRDTIGAGAAGHLDLAFRAFTTGHGAELGTNYLRWLTREPHPMGNVAIVSDRDDSAGTLAAAEPLVTRNVPSAILFPHGVTDAVARSVVAMGFEVQGAMPAMAVDIDRLAATALPPGYAWARVGTGSGGSAWAEALGVGYGLPPGLARRFAPETLGADMAADARTQYFAIVRDGRTVATSLLYLADGLAGIYCVATVPEERGKGLGAHATAEALRTARRLGYGVGVLQSSPAGHSVYLGLGFADFAEVPMFVRLPQ
jgi:GNAT superfamily N-acetyltransferase